MDILKVNSSRGGSIECALRRVSRAETSSMPVIEEYTQRRERKFAPGRLAPSRSYKMSSIHEVVERPDTQFGRPPPSYLVPIQHQRGAPERSTFLCLIVSIVCATVGGRRLWAWAWEKCICARTDHD